MESKKLYKKIVKSSLNYEKFIDLGRSVVENEVLCNIGTTMPDGTIYTPTDEDVRILIEDFSTNMAYGSAYTRNKYLAIGGVFGIVATCGVIIGMKKLQKKKDEEC